jgi:ubiquinol-cytochrome c reductase cytochrome c1 subunit
MKNWIVCAVFSLLLHGVTLASGGDVELKHVEINHDNKASLQRGAQLFNNYCLSCHSVKYMRYKRVMDDLEIPEEIMKKNLMFTSDKLEDLMIVAMPNDDAKRWFGKVPPDLSLSVRQRGEAWVYTYLVSFYQEEGSPTGVNNLVLKNASMPHVLAPLQGLQKAVFEEKPDADGQVRHVFKRFELINKGEMTTEEYERAAKDLVNYMGYLAEPIRTERQSVGIWVMLFLAVLGIFTYLLKLEYWKDVH